MNTYRDMAVRYLKLNKRRSMVTVIGVAVAVTILYTVLNLGWSRLLQQRKELREEMDYEIVFLTETAEQAEALMADDRVKSASVGQYYVEDYENPVMYDTALYVNTNNPYRMEAICAELQTEYGVEGRLNEALAETYLQGDEGNMTFILIMYVLLFSYIFAIFGVGIVRNSIQLSILEQIKDYGNLRCVGSTKSQLKSVVYIQGAILELSGNALGIVVGWIASMIIGHFLKWEVGFHLFPILPIVIAFLGDLYFAMEENCKVLVNMTPVSAIRGEYRIRKEKIKVRKSRIFGKLFGVEGDYAYKSIMRNPGRFRKTVWSLGVGMAAFVAVMGATSTANAYIKRVDKMCGYYHVYCNRKLEIGDIIEEINTPSVAVYQAIAKLEAATDAKRVYCAEVLPKEKISDDFSDIGGIACYGYDETDYRRYEQALVEGTLDVSDHGLVLVNSGSLFGISEEDIPEDGPGWSRQNIKFDSLGFANITYTDYRVGDTIDIVDMKRYRAMYTEKVEVLTAEYDKEMAKLPELTEEEQRSPKAYKNTPQAKLTSEYYENRRQASRECKEQLIAEGAYKTYTIEGIVSRDVNHGSEEYDMEFVLPLDRYYALTGTDETVVNGMQYHFDLFPEEAFTTAVNGAGDGTMWLWTITMYPTIQVWIVSLRMVARGILLFVTFIILMTAFNVINTTASNLHLRRKEFAQLRVIGVSKKRLMKMVMLEGVIADMVAGMIGVILGTVFGIASYGMVVMLIGGKIHFPFIETLIGILVATLITCGSIYVPLKGLKQDMAADLATGGD